MLRLTDLIPIQLLNESKKIEAYSRTERTKFLDTWRSKYKQKGLDWESNNRLSFIQPNGTAIFLNLTNMDLKQAEKYLENKLLIKRNRR